MRLVKCVVLLLTTKHVAMMFIGITTESLTSSQCPTFQDNDLNVTWPSTAPATCVASIPVCIDNKMEVAKRCCSYRGEWKKSPACIFTQEKPPSCPENFHYDMAKELCYIFTEPSAYPSRCPYRNIVPFGDSKVIVDQLTNEPVWMPVVRDNTTRKGFFVWQEFSVNYKQLYEEEIHNKSFKVNNCVLYHNKTAKAIPCSEHHRSICAYTKLDSSASYCLDKMKVCRRYEYTHKNKCFCVQYASVGGLNTTTSAEILLPYQNSIVKALTPESCSIGIKREKDGRYIWTRSGNLINYTNWSPKASFDAYNKHGVFTNDGWILVSDMADIKCNIYEAFVEESEPNFELNFNFHQHRFEISLNKDEFKEFDYNSNILLFCFTNGWEFADNISRIIINNEDGLLTFSPFPNSPSYYWCDGVKYSTFQVIQTNKVFYRKNISYFTCEYVAIVSCLHCFRVNDVINREVVAYVKRTMSNILTNHQVRIFKILDVDYIKRTNTFNIHITEWLIHRYSCLQKYEYLQEFLKSAVLSSHGLRLERLFTTDYCTHECYAGLTWPDTPIGHFAYPKELCLTPRGHIIQRNCVGNFEDGARWENLTETCKIKDYSCVTKDLHDLLVSNMSSTDIIKGLNNITSNHTNFASLDIFLISAIINKVSDHAVESLEAIVNITNSLNFLEKQRLKNAEKEFHATNSILKDLDHIFSEINVSNSKQNLQVRSNTTFIVASSVTSNISGVVLYRYDNRQYNVTVLESEQDLAMIMKDPFFRAALVIPSELKSQIINASLTSKIIFVVFVKDSLFNAPENKSNTEQNVSQIFDVLIPGFEESFVKPIVIYYKTKTHNQKQSCVYWQFEDQDGFWKNDSNSKTEESFKKCEFWHVTHFALLLVDDPAVEEINFGHILDIITDVNCMLSLFGLLVILLTAILFKRWRTNTGNKILVNFVFAIAFQISLLYVSDSIHKYVKINDLCTIVGALLQYSIISEFCWMLIIAILQFRRFVDVLGGQPKYVILKACIIGWILPLFPVLCVLFLDPKSYVKSKIGLCYPSGLSLYLSIWLPVGIIVAINAVIFTYILYSVSTRNTECLVDSSELYYQWRLAVLLFFMLGLTWSFGLLLQLDFGTLFVYLFTFSATLQGFVMFLFFIIFNKNTRSLYILHLRNFIRTLKRE